MLDRVGDSRDMLELDIPPCVKEKVIEFSMKVEPYAKAGHCSYCRASAWHFYTWGMGADDFCLHGNLILPDAVLENAFLTVEGRKIATVDRQKPSSYTGPVTEVKDGYISPGFIDIHVHGGDGADYMDGVPDAVRTANRAHLRHGTTTIFPTTTTGSTEQLDCMVRACVEVRDSWSVADGSFIGGIHFYGPYFAEEKVGCHSVEGRRDPKPEEYQYFFSLGVIRVATCAAELPGAVPFYRAAQKHRCLITCGHSNANWGEMKAAFEAGVRHVDHFWCAMSSVSSLRARCGTPMQASMEQFVLAKQEMSTEVIADGQHLSPELLDFAFQMKGAARLCLVTDSNRALDMPPGRYRFGSGEDGPWMESNGEVGFVPGHGLASSVMGMDTMVRNMASQTSARLPEVIRMASLTPAERLGMADEIGSLEVGKYADLLVLDRNLQIKRVFVRGQEFTSAAKV
jgi:N-acetylglucosamine-6-phosphate deacetylase